MDQSPCENPSPYMGEMYILQVDEDKLIHVKNRGGCIGKTDQFILAWKAMWDMNWQIVHRAGLKFIPILFPEEPTHAHYNEAMEKQNKAWLN